MTWRDQPRWPSGTPGGGHKPGPGPGRWRDGDAPGSGTGSGGGGWLRRLSDLISRRGRRGRDSSLRPWETDAEDARRQQDIRRRYGLPEDASPEETGEAIRYFATRGQAGSPGRSTRRLDGDPLSNPVMRMADGSTPAGDYTAAGDGGDDYDARLFAWEDEATRYMRDQHNFSQERIDRFWENVALGGGAGPDDNPDPREWVDQEIADGILDDDPDLEFNDGGAYRPRTLPDGSADPSNQMAWEDEVRRILRERGFDPADTEAQFEGFGSEYQDWSDSPSDFVDSVLEQLDDLDRRPDMIRTPGQLGADTYGPDSDDPFIAPEGYGDWMGTPEHTEWSNRVSAIMSRPDNHLDPSDLYHEPPTREEYERYKDDPEGYVRDTYDIEVASGSDWAGRVDARLGGSAMSPEAWSGRVEELLADRGLVGELDLNDQADYPSPEAYVEYLIANGLVQSMEDL